MDELKNLRDQIDSVDDKLFELINHRANLVKKIGDLKKQNDLSIIDKHREAEIFKKVLLKSKKEGLDKEAIKKIWECLIDISYKIEGGK